MSDNQSLSAFLTHPHDAIAAHAVEYLIDMLRRAGVAGEPVTDALVNAALNRIEEGGRTGEFDEAIRRIEARREEQRTARRASFRQEMEALAEAGALPA